MSCYVMSCPVGVRGQGGRGWAGGLGLLGATPLAHVGGFPATAGVDRAGKLVLIPVMDTDPPVFEDVQPSQALEFIGRLTWAAVQFEKVGQGVSIRPRRLGGL